jgi:hypothetical protein
MRLLYEHHARDMQLARQAFATRLCAPPPPPKEARRRLFGFFTELVSEAQACGEIRADVDPELVSDLLRLSYFRHMVARGSGGDWQSAEYFEYIIDLLMDGLAGPNWRHE